MAYEARRRIPCASAYVCDSDIWRLCWNGGVEEIAAELFHPEVLVIQSLWPQN